MQPAQPLAAPSAQATQAGQFGPLIEEFAGATLANTLYGLLFLILAAGGVGLFVTDQNNNLVYGLIGLVFLIFAALLVISSALNSRNTVAAYRDGLVVLHGSQVEAIPWDSVRNFYQRVIRYRQAFVITATSRRYLVERADGKRFVFSQYKNVARLGEIILRETTTRKLAQAQGILATGQQLIFGRLTLSQAGLSNGKETLPWSEVSGVNVVNGAITISRQGKRLPWASPRVQNIPNFMVFVTIAQSLASGKR